MKRIDFYIQHLVKHGAQEVLLASGEPVLFRFPTGERRSNTPIEHAQVQTLVQEAAGPAHIQMLRSAGEVRFEHKGEAGIAVGVHVKTGRPGVWEVSISPQRGDADATNGRGKGPPPSPGSRGAAASAVASGSAMVETLGKSTSDPVRQNAEMRLSDVPAATPILRGNVDIRIGRGEPKINRLLKMMVQVEASDLHLSSGVVPMCRLHGDMQPLEERGAMTHEELTQLLTEIMPPRSRKQFDEINDTDFAHTIEGVARFRANIFMDRKGIGAVFRQIPFEILAPEMLGLPSQVLDLCYLTKGLVLVTGPTGSGKSTTLATLIDVVNQRRADHIITIEDPIEFVHKNKRCLVNQREIGTHTAGFKNALRAALREDPDIVLVGEMRDLETIAIAIETAETGHLVFGTLHTTSASSTVDRVIDQFPPDRQAQIRTMLSESLRGVVAQVLCKRRGGGRVAAFEVLIANAAVSNLIREGKTYQLTSVMQTGKALGMQTMNEHLLAHVKADIVEPEEAYMKSNDKSGFRDLLKRERIPLNLS